MWYFIDNSLKGYQMITERSLRKLSSPFIFTLVLLLFSGCLKNKLLISVDKDGSGHVVSTLKMGIPVAKMLKAQFEQYRDNLPPESKIKTFEDMFFRKELLEQKVRFFGGDLKLVKSKNMSWPDGSFSCIAVYSFKDITKIKIPLNKVLIDIFGNDGSIEFAFKKEKDGTSKLTVKLPKIEKAVEKKSEKKEETGKDLQKLTAQEQRTVRHYMGYGNPFGLTGKEGRKELIVKFFTDMVMEVAVEVNGKLIKSNASNPDKQDPRKVLLLRGDFTEMLEIKEFTGNMSKFLAAGRGAKVTEFIQVLNKYPQGFIYENKGEITMEYK